MSDHPEPGGRAAGPGAAHRIPTPEVALLRSEERYRRLFEGMPVALYRTTPGGRIIDANRALADLLGYDSVEELLDLQVRDAFVDPGERDRSRVILESTGRLTAFEEQLIRRDGTRIWVRDSSRIIRSETGDIEFYEGALVDVTQRRQAEELLSARARQQWAVAELGQLALAGTPLPRVFEAAIKSVRRVLGVDAARILLADEPGGRMRLVAGSGIEEGVEPATGAGEEGRAHLNSGDRDGALFSTAGRGSGMRVPLVGADGVLGVLGAATRVVRDFPTDDANFMQGLANVLAAAIESSRARQRLEELVRSKDEFLAGISHELRTPLTAVVGFASELEQQWHDFDEDTRRALVGTIAAQSREMADIIEDLLVASRADLGALALNPGPVRLMEQVGHVLAGFAGPDASRVTFRGRAAVAWADPSRVRQILRNLISNALRYGGPHIEVLVEPGPDEVRLEVADDGPGIPEADRERIFEAYQRAHETGGHQPASVGIGLTVSRQLATLMNGSLRYESEGRSVFALILPPAPAPFAPFDERV